MSQLLSSIISTEADFIPKSYNWASIGSGVSGDILVLTPPAGQRVRLTHLSLESGDEEAGITITFGAAIILDNGTISGYDPRATNAAGKIISIGSYFPYAGATPPAGNFPQLTAGVNEEVKINKTGSTAAAIYYSYEFGE